MSHPLDEIDRQIVELLRESGRRSNRDVARVIGVTEATVRARMRRLLNEGIMQIVAVTNPVKRGYTMDVSFSIKVDFDRLMAIAHQLAALENVRYLAVTTGYDDIRFSALFRSTDDFRRFLTETLTAMPGIRKVETSQVIALVKHTYDWLLTAADSLDSASHNQTNGRD